MDNSSSEENKYKEEREDGNEVDGDVAGNSERLLIFPDVLWLQLLQ